MRVFLLLLIAAGTVSAQRRSEPKTIEQDPIIGIRPVRRSDSAYTEVLVTRRCPPVVMAEPTPPDAERTTKFTISWCSADTAYALPAADGARWLGAVYSRHEVHRSDSVRRELVGNDYDTVTVITAVLYRASERPSMWIPEWAGTVAKSMVRSIDVHSVPRPDKSMLATIGYCFNGTGGCWQRYLRRVNAKWSPVTEAFWKQLPPIDDGSVGKGLGIDISKLTGSYGLYSRGDGNCCPSRELHLVLDQRGDTLVLKSHEIRRVPPP